MAIPLTAREPVEFTPPSLPKKLQGLDPDDPTKNRFRALVRVPTMLERDNYAGLLIRGGVMSYSKQQIRELCLAGVQSMFDKAEHEAKQNLLREAWVVRDAEEECEQAQRQKLRELTEKATAVGQPLTPQEMKAALEEFTPSAVMDPSRKIEATALQQELMSNFLPLKKVLADLVEQDAKRAWLNAEVYVKDFIGLPDRPEGNGRGGLQHHEIEYLRRAIGEDAFHELSDFITAIQTVDEDEEKNLASLLESTSAPIGSIQSESTASSDHGNSTATPSGRTQGSTGSRKTTGSSSGSTNRSATKTAKSRKAGRTAKRSSTSP